MAAASHLILQLHNSHPANTAPNVFPHCATTPPSHRYPPARPPAPMQPQGMVQTAGDDQGLRAQLLEVTL